MKVLVAGKGFLGERIGERLSEKHRVKYLDRTDADYCHDVTESFSIGEKFDCLVHTIGLAPGFHTREEYHQVQVDGTRNLLEAVECEKVVVLSALGAGKVNHSFFTTKRESERIVEESGNKYTILRPSTVFGEGNKLLDMISNLAPTRVFPDIPTRTQPILVEDLVEIASLKAENPENGKLELGGPEKMRIGEMAQVIYSREGYRCLLVPAPEFLLKNSLKLFGFFPPPFNRENVKLMGYSNVTDGNDAERFLDPRSIMDGSL